MDFNKEGRGAFFTTLLWKYFAFRRWSLNLALTQLDWNISNYVILAVMEVKYKVSCFPTPSTLSLPIELHVIELHRCKGETEVSEVNYFMGYILLLNRSDLNTYHWHWSFLISASFFYSLHAFLWWCSKIN